METKFCKASDTEAYHHSLCSTDSSMTAKLKHDYTIEGICFDGNSEGPRNSSIEHYDNMCNRSVEDDGYEFLIEDERIDIMIPVEVYDVPTKNDEDTIFAKSPHFNEDVDHEKLQERNVQKSKSENNLYLRNSLDIDKSLVGRSQKENGEKQKSTLKKNLSFGALNNTNKDESTKRPMKRNVSFSSLSVREYSLTLGDNPSCSKGPPVCLDWDYSSESNFGLDKFEAEREPRRTRSEMHMGSHIRRNILHYGAGYSQQELKVAVNEVSLIQQRRKQTIERLHVSKLEEALESAVRKVKRIIK